MTSWNDETATGTESDAPATGGTGPVVSTTSDANAGTLTVIGKLKDGKLVKSWNGTTKVLSDRTINAIQGIGITIVDDPEQYLF